MAGTRSSSRNPGSSPAKSDDAVAGSKRKPEAEPSPKQSRKASKKQATLEQTGITNEDNEMKDTINGGDAQESEPEAKDDAPKVQEDGESTNDEKDASDDPAKVETTNDDPKGEANNDAAKPDPVEHSSQREKEVPSKILEKGLIYFFTRNRVGIDDAESVGDLQRTFFVLRPLPTGAKLGEGAIPDLKNNRLFALPKKTLPKSHTDRFMAFVEKANTTIQDLKDNFCK